jgi:hypothetical protein
MKYCKLVVAFLIFVIFFQFARFVLLPYLDKTLINIFQNNFQSGLEFTTRESCQQNHGDWGRTNLLPQEFCRIPTNDYSKPCFSGFECQAGACLYDISSNILPFGRGFCAKYKEFSGTFIKLHFGFKGNPSDVNINL